MLVMSRIPGEIIRIGHDIEVRILSVDGQKVRLGIEAPKGLDIHREEVYRDIEAQGRRGGRGRPPVRKADETPPGQGQ